MDTSIRGDGYRRLSINRDTWAMLERAHDEGIQTVWDRLAAQETGLRIITEVMDPRDVGLVAEYADILSAAIVSWA